jgi:hypothetical protein
VLRAVEKCFLAFYHKPSEIVMAQIVADSQFLIVFCSPTTHYAATCETQGAITHFVEQLQWQDENNGQASNVGKRKFN